MKRKPSIFVISMIIGSIIICNVSYAIADGITVVGINPLDESKYYVIEDVRYLQIGSIIHYSVKDDTTIAEAYIMKPSLFDYFVRRGLKKEEDNLERTRKVAAYMGSGKLEDGKLIILKENEEFMAIGHVKYHTYLGEYNRPILVVEGKKNAKNIKHIKVLDPMD